MSPAVARAVIWATLLLVGIAVSYGALQWHPGATPGGHEEHALGPARLFDVSAAALSAVELVAAGAVTRFERDGEGRWFRHAHEQAAGEAAAGHEHALDAAAADALDKAFRLLANARHDRIVASGEPLDRRSYGLVDPSLVALVYRSGLARPLLILEFGDLTPDGLGRYVLLPQRRMIIQLPDYQARGLTALLPGGSGS